MEFFHNVKGFCNGKREIPWSFATKWCNLPRRETLHTNSHSSNLHQKEVLKVQLQKQLFNRIKKWIKASAKFLMLETLSISGENKILQKCRITLIWPFWIWNMGQSHSWAFHDFIPLFFVFFRCLLSFRPGLWQCQGTKCQTLQDQEAGQRGILHHVTHTVQYFTAAGQPLPP